MVCPSSAPCKQGLPFNLPPTIWNQRARLGRRIGVQLNEGQTVQYEIESNRGKESAINLKVK